MGLGCRLLRRSREAPPRDVQAKKVADKRLDDIKQELRQGTHLLRYDIMTVSQAAESWLQACKIGRNGGHPVEASILRLYQGHQKYQINPLFGWRKLSDLKKPDIERFRDLLLSGDPKHNIKPRSRAAAAKVMTSLRSILEEANMQHNPACGVKVVIGGRHKARVMMPSRAEIKKDIRGAG